MVKRRRKSPPFGEMDHIQQMGYCYRYAQECAKSIEMSQDDVRKMSSLLLSAMNMFDKPKENEDEECS